MDGEEVAARREREVMAEAAEQLQRQMMEVLLYLACTLLRDSLLYTLLPTPYRPHRGVAAYTHAC